eukprot:5315885-Pleurochrysis_carterae.AAC.1
MRLRAPPSLSLAGARPRLLLDEPVAEVVGVLDDGALQLHLRGERARLGLVALERLLRAVSECALGIGRDDRLRIAELLVGDDRARAAVARALGALLRGALAVVVGEGAVLLFLRLDRPAPMWRGGAMEAAWRKGWRKRTSGLDGVAV